jgi:hypothetical protein
MAPRSIFIFIVACFCASGGQCHSFKQVKRRFDQPHVNRLTRPFSPSRSFAKVQTFGPSQFYFSTRGGDISDDYDEADDGTSAFSQFIASFESELSDIRREAEMEAEIEMQRLFGLVDESQMGGDNEEMGEDVEDQQQLNIKYYNERSDGELQSVPVEEVSDADDNISTKYEQIEVAEEVVQNESELSENEHDVSDSVGNEEDIDDLDDEEEQEFAAIASQTDEQLGEQQEHNTIDSDETQQDVASGEAEQNNEAEEAENIDSLDEEQEVVTLPIDEASTSDIDENQQHTDIISSSITEPIGSSDLESNIDEMEVVPEKKLKKQRKSKSKKKTSPKVKKVREIMLDDDELDLTDELDYSNSYGLSSVSITKQKEIQKSKTGLRYYLQTDLVRATVLFIATIVISVWLQRVQRQMEAQGI